MSVTDRMRPGIGTYPYQPTPVESDEEDDKIDFLQEIAICTWKLWSHARNAR
jgi:hypothetical protein